MESKSSEATDASSVSALDITNPIPAVEAGPLTKISRPVDAADGVVSIRRSRLVSKAAN